MRPAGEYANVKSGAMRDEPNRKLPSYFSPTNDNSLLSRSSEGCKGMEGMGGRDTLRKTFLTVLELG